MCLRKTLMTGTFPTWHRRDRGERFVKKTNKSKVKRQRKQWMKTAKILLRNWNYKDVLWKCKLKSMNQEQLVHHVADPVTHGGGLCYVGRTWRRRIRQV